MNFIGHHEVARQLSAEQDHALMFGAMVPDFVGMFRLRKLYKTEPVRDPKIQEGIRLHTSTNTAFDNNFAIKILEREMINSFLNYLPKWTAVQAGKAGKDILFDSIFQNDFDALFSYIDTMEVAANGMLDITNVTDVPATFSESLQRLKDSGVAEYDNSEVVAARLQRRLDGTLTPIEPELVPAVTDTIESYKPQVLMIGQVVMEQVVGELAKVA